MPSFSALDQLLLELTNRARLDPEGEARRHHIDLNRGLATGTIDGSSKQPLAPNDLLRTSSLSHSDWMLDRDVFSHTGAGGSSGFSRMSKAGYDFNQGGWSWGENIAWSGTTNAFLASAHLKTIASNLFLSPSHRLNLLDDDFREAGIGGKTGAFTSGGVTYKAFMTTQNFAQSGEDRFVTGVAIRDRDGDQFYDIGEGIGGVRIALLDALGLEAGSTATGAAGGYALTIGSDPVHIQITGGLLAGPVDLILETGGENAKIDVVNASLVLSSVTTTLGDGAQNLRLLGVDDIDATGNASANVLTGNKGDNRLDGGHGADRISGQQGDDVLVGGDGDDRLHGGAGGDMLDGGRGDDRLIGSLGRDLLTGGEGSDVFVFAGRTSTGTTAATRDVITDFDPAFDTIDFRSLDANLGKRGNQAFTWIGDAPLTKGPPGQLHAVKTLDAVDGTLLTIIEGDMNGDGRADFQVALLGHLDLDRGDFIL